MSGYMGGLVTNTTPESRRSTARSRTAQMLQRQIREAQEKLTLLERMPDGDTYPNGAMVRVTVRTSFNDEPLTYLLLKVITGDGGHEPGRSRLQQSRWYFTGVLFQRGGSQRQTNSQRWLLWDELTSWLINDVELETWDELYVLDKMDNDLPSVPIMNDDRS